MKIILLLYFVMCCWIIKVSLSSIGCSIKGACIQAQRIKDSSVQASSLKLWLFRTMIEWFSFRWSQNYKCQTKYPKRNNFDWSNWNNWSWLALPKYLLSRDILIRDVRQNIQNELFKLVISVSMRCSSPSSFSSFTNREM